MQLFYSPEIDTGLCTLDPEESRHAVRVLRMRTGDIIHVTNGRGALFHCRITEANEHACTVETQGPAERSDTCPRLTLAVAPTKNPARMEWLVEKAVEVGVSEVQLLQCDHSERTFLKTDRLQRVALSAMKQSLHTLLPAVKPAAVMKEWLETAHLQNMQKFIAHCEDDKPRTPIAKTIKIGLDTVVLIGPEGDFSTEEIALALAHGFQPVSLGPSRLRTETAAIYAAVAFSQTNH